MIRSMLLGTAAGLLHELVVEEATASRREPGPPRQLLDLKDARKSVCGLHQVCSVLIQGCAQERVRPASGVCSH